ncbi:MAG TPA: PDGLE domain-containing protein [Acidimicrobiia bacterium]
MRDRRLVTFLALGLVVTFLLGVVVSQFASGNPDGLEFVAGQEGFADAARDHDLGDGPLADYGVSLTDNDVVNTAIAGAAGVLITLIVGYGVFALARRARGDHPVES